MLLAGAAGVLGQPVTPDRGSNATLLIQRQGLQKQRLIQGQAATQLSHSQAKDVAAMAHPASAPKLVTEADVKLRREERLRRLNAAKVDASDTP